MAGNRCCGVVAARSGTNQFIHRRRKKKKFYVYSKKSSVEQILLALQHQLKIFVEHITVGLQEIITRKWPQRERPCMNELVDIDIGQHLCNGKKHFESKKTIGNI